jgi:hypothetical protein
MATLTQIREAIATRLQTISGLNVSPTVTGQITPPAAVVAPATESPVDYDTSLSGTTDYHLVITLLVSRADETAGQNNLDPYVDPTGANSVHAAVNGTLGGLVDDANVGAAGRYGNINYNAVDFYGCEFPVTVMA